MRATSSTACRATALSSRSPIRPSSHFIGSGDVLRSQHGRLLSPVPKLPTRSNEGLRLSLARIDAWLAQEAKTEAAAHPDKFLPQYFDPKNMSHSDRLCANLILFGDEDGPADEHRVNPTIVNGRLVAIETG